MGFDVHGVRPKINKKLDDTTIYGMTESIASHQERWEVMDNLSEEDRKTYWKEYEKHHDDNPGLYFRNNVWWWRPLWIFICSHCEDIMTDSNMRGGTYNDGHRIDENTAINISDRLFDLIKDGTVDKYSEFYEKERKLAEKSDDKDAKWLSQYPFSKDNVERFALFCKESGGFDIC